MTLGVDLYDVMRGDVPAAKILRLLGQLPDTSALAASLRGGPEFRGWGHDRWLAKGLYDAVNTGTFVAMRVAAGDKASKVKAFDPWPAPKAQRKAIAPTVRLSDFPGAIKTN